MYKQVCRQDEEIVRKQDLGAPHVGLRSFTQRQIPTVRREHVQSVAPDSAGDRGIALLDGLVEIAQPLSLIVSCIYKSSEGRRPWPPRWRHPVPAVAARISIAPHALAGPPDAGFPQYERDSRSNQPHPTRP